MTAWVDANVLLRFITKTPIEMAERAMDLLRRAESGLITLRVHPLTVAETVWVLQSHYGYEKRRITDEVGSLLLTKALQAVDGDATVAALHEMADRNVDFADALLVQLARGNGDRVASFDGDFRRLGVAGVEF
jgi:predicted nucleic acid-binding protein